MFMQKIIEKIKNTTVVPENKFYLYHQNNSGGDFLVNISVDISVIIEANNIYSANKIAKKHGIYFNGVERGIDCPCCGDRWDDSPMVYDTLNEAIEDTYTVFNGGAVIYMATGYTQRVKVRR